MLNAFINYSQFFFTSKKGPIKQNTPHKCTELLSLSCSFYSYYTINKKTNIKNVTFLFLLCITIEKNNYKIIIFYDYYLLFLKRRKETNI